MAAIRRHASLFTVALIVLILATVLVLTQSPVMRVGMTPAELGAAMPGPKMLGLSLIGLLARVLVQTPCALAVHRYVLLGEGGDRDVLGDRERLVRFGLCLLALNLLLFIPSSLQMLTVSLAIGHRAIAAVLGLGEFILVIAAIVVGVRLVLTLPGASVDQPDPWGASWRLSRGHWWRIVGTMILALVGLLVPLGLATALAQHLGSPVVAGVISAVTGVLTIAVGAAVASLLYRQYGGGAVPAGAIW